MYTLVLVVRAKIRRVEPRDRLVAHRKSPLVAFGTLPPAGERFLQLQRGVVRSLGVLHRLLIVQVVRSVAAALSKECLPEPVGTRVGVRVLLFEGDVGHVGR